MVRKSTSRFASRRRIVEAGAVGGLIGVAGCLGDDGPEDADDAVDDGDDVPADDTDDVDDGDDVDDIDDGDEAVPEIQEYHDADLQWSHAFDLPADLQYNVYADGPSTPTNAFVLRNYDLVVRSVADLELYGLLVDDWSYEPGVLELTFHDDYYWWSGEQVTVDDYLTQLEFEDYYWGGDDLDDQEAIVTRERIDELTVRLALADAWHEEWAIHETVEGLLLNSSRTFLRPWIEEFEDAPDLDAIQDIRDDHEDNAQVTDDEELVYMYNTLHEFRFDGSIGGVGEDFFEVEAVPTKDGNIRHWANPENHDILPNVETIRLNVREEEDVARQDGFLENTHPLAYGERWPEAVEMHLDGEFDFDTDLYVFPRPPNDQGGMQFNHETHPSDDPNFRRAMAYLTDNTAWENHPDAVPAERLHTFLSEEELEAFVSAETIDAFTEYGWNEMRFDDAAAELEAGGFERNADGDWIMLEDGDEGDAGEAMSFTFDVPTFMGYVVDQGSDWFADLEGFGIGNEVIEAGFDGEEWTVTYTYTGGGTPDHAFNHVFNDAAPNWSRRDQNVPSTILASPFLEASGPGAEVEEWVEYDVGAMTDRLPVTTDAEQYQQLVDELSWVINQACNHYSTAPVQRHHVVDVENWHWPALDEIPERYSNLLMDVGSRVCRYPVD